MHIYFYTVKPKFILFTKHFIYQRLKNLIYCVTHICLQSLLQNKKIYPPPPPPPPTLKQNCNYMVPPFDKYITLFLQSSVSTFTRVRKSNIIYQSFFVKHVYIIKPLKSDIFFIDYMFTWPGHNYQIYIYYIN